MIDNKKIKTTESLQMRFSNEVKPCNRNRETNTSSFRNNTIIFLVFFAVNVMIYCAFVCFVV